MKIFIKKISSILLLTLLLFFNSCDDEKNLQISSPEAEFVLKEPEINTVYLNFGLPQNPALTVSWKDDLTGSSNYTVEMSLNSEFTAISAIGSTSSKDFTISVQDLNEAIRDSGVETFRDISIYVRIKAGSVLSNSVLFFVTTYPTDPPVLTSPANGASFPLSISNSGNTALTANWTDVVLNSDLDIDVTYVVEAALAGTNFATTASLGSIPVNATTLSVTHGNLNSVALGLGLTAGTAGNLDLRLKGSNTNESLDVLTRTSLTRTISVTPYSITFPNLYLVGSATSPGWNNNNNNTVVFRNQNVPNNYVYTGYFSAGAFKLLEVKGQWQPQWGTTSVPGALGVNPGGGSDPGTFDVATSGYYTYNFTTVGQGGSFTVTPFDASTSPTYSTMGIIGQAIGGWGASDEINFTQDANNPHLWYALGVTFTSGNEFLIRANDAWNTVWRYNGSQQLYGTSILAGSGNNFPFNGATGSYNVWFNDLDGRYILIPQ